VAINLNHRLNIFLCDLTHDTQILVSDTIPINVGFVASYAQKTFGNEVDIELFKYPDTLLSALHQETPDVIGFSNYSWNSRLSERFARYAKELYPEVVTVMGGTNFPQEESEQVKYLESRPEIDCHIFNEGEVSFSNIVTAILDARDNSQRIFDNSIPGVCFIDPDSRKDVRYRFLSGMSVERLKNLDDIPSPYLNGMLDKFFDGRLTPFIETNRGCPFTCSFCHTGHASLSRISKFSPQRITDEIAYIGSRAKKLKISNLHIADTNFGMYSSDIETCKALADSQKQFGWPTQIQATTGKNSKKKIIEVTKVMGTTLAVNMSVQSMDKNVLENIERSNINLEDYKDIHKTLMSQGRPSNGELIVGLPGETRESFVTGLRQVIDAGVTRVANYTLMLLYGTQFKDPKYRKTYSIKGKFRLVPLNFGEYMGEKVFDIEEVGIETNTMRFEDYLWLRGLCLFVEVLYNNRPFYPIFRYLETLSIQQFDFILQLYEKRHKAPPEINNLVKGFEKETKNELWDTEEEITSYYCKDGNYNKLFSGDVGGNLIYKYKAASLADHSSNWVDFIRNEVANQIDANELTEDEKSDLLRELNVVCEFTELRLNGVLAPKADTTVISKDFQYDVMKWLNSNSDSSSALRDYVVRSKISYEFGFTARQLAERDEFFTRYGSHTNGLSKIVARVTNVEQLFRNVRQTGIRNVDVNERVTDELVRYAISN